jgi:ABC-type polysaccharide/polyol phosphate export permease
MKKTFSIKLINKRTNPPFAFLVSQLFITLMNRLIHLISITILVLKSTLEAEGLDNYVIDHHRTEIANSNSLLH